MCFDSGMELVNAETKAWAGQRGIDLEVTAPYSQSQNGVAERFNCTHMELARAMLFAVYLNFYGMRQLHMLIIYEIGSQHGHLKE